VIHDFALAAKRTHRHAATDDLAERRQIRNDTVALLRTAEPNAKPCHYFIEDQHAAGFIATIAQGLQKAAHGRHAIHVAGDRLDDDAGNLIPDFGKGLFHLFAVVVLEGHRVIGECRGHPRGTRHA